MQKEKLLQLIEKMNEKEIKRLFSFATGIQKAKEVADSK